MRFAAYAAVGILTLPIGGPLLWLPFVGGAFLLSVYRPDGKGLDERAGDYVRWRWRRRRPSAPRPPRHPSGPNDGVVRLPGPHLVAVLEAGGVPTRFLPPADARELFDRYRTLLRSVDRGLYLRVGVSPIPLGGFRLPSMDLTGPREQAARDGYEEMVRLLLRRRLRRRVRLVAHEPGRGVEAARRLESTIEGLSGRLWALGVPHERLDGAELRSVLEEIGWSAEELS